MESLIIIFAIIGLAALVHSSFQLSISVLTLLSGRSLSLKRSNQRQLRLTSSFVAGSAVTTILLLCTIAFSLQHFAHAIPQTFVWLIVCGLLLSVGIAVWLFYYRRDRGTSLWIPRGMADYLADRAKASQRSAETFTLGVVSVLAELLFVIAPLATAAFAIIHLPTEWQLIGIAAYTVISLSTLLLVSMLVSAGHKLSRIQKWRETNKGFLQFAAGSGLIVLGVYIYVNEVLALGGGMG